jgi:adenylate cyclase
MPEEIERKFLVTGEGWRSLGTPTLYRQGYLPTTAASCTVRVRVVGDQGYLTIKGPSQGISRSEFEYPIPLAEAEAMLDTLCQKPLIEKTRTRVPLGEVVWEVDEFLGENAGLVVAEVELKSADQVVALPEWIGAEVSGDRRYYNASLVGYPFSRWGEGFDS